MLLLKGILLGLAIAAPVGPIGILCIRRALVAGPWVGVASGLGAATADGCYGAIAALGLTAISGAMIAYRWPLQIVGGLFLIYLGVTTARQGGATVAPDSALDSASNSVPGSGGNSAAGAALAPHALAQAYGSTLALTLTNPATILTFGAIFVGMGFGTVAETARQGIPLVVGVFLGSALWWLFLSWGVSRLRSRLTPRRLGWLNRIAGASLATFGLLAVIPALLTLLTP